MLAPDGFVSRTVCSGRAGGAPAEVNGAHGRVHLGRGHRRVHGEKSAAVVAAAAGTVGRPRQRHNATGSARPGRARMTRAWEAAILRVDARPGPTLAGYDTPCRPGRRLSTSIEFPYHHAIMRSPPDGVAVRKLYRGRAFHGLGHDVTFPNGNPRTIRPCNKILFKCILNTGDFSMDFSAICGTRSQRCLAADPPTLWGHRRRSGRVKTAQTAGRNGVAMPRSTTKYVRLDVPSLDIYSNICHHLQFLPVITR